ncbi:MAG: 4Fe-4S ferredoxin iron-sulfur binding domain protein [Burkholderiaceae bacterium]|nr:4Fe-4S ferredoxin iron-sulfur binding domain protein [Burkholderiaceae bacterium]
MLKLFKTILKAGEATLKYPFAPLPVCDNFRGKPEHQPEQCIACAACAVACPANALTMSTDAEAGTITWSFFVGRCIFCGRCEEVCPTKAIVLSPEFELAVANAADMYQHATFKLAQCSECGEYFAPKKEVEYTADLLKQAGMTAEAVESIDHLLHTCTDCKRKQNVPEAHQVEFTRYLKGNEA